MTPKLDTFSERLRQLIGENSVSSFGKKCGIGESTLRQYLKGGMPGLDKLVAIAEAANANIEWLAIGGGPMRPGEMAKEDSTTTVAAMQLWGRAMLSNRYCTVMLTFDFCK